METRRYSLRTLFVGRGRLDTIAWIACLVLAAVSVARAIRTGEGWGSAILLTAVSVAYTFVPWVRQMQIGREQKANGTLTIDEWGVKRVVGDVREAVAWSDLAWVRIYTTSRSAPKARDATVVFSGSRKPALRAGAASAGPAIEDVFFALGGADGKGCLVPHDLAVRSNLLAILQERLPGLDNEQIIRAMASADDAYFTIWTRPAPGGSSPTTLN